MKHSENKLKHLTFHNDSGLLEHVPYGFSWTILFFNSFVPLFRSNSSHFKFLILIDVLLLVFAYVWYILLTFWQRLQYLYHDLAKLKPLFKDINIQHIKNNSGKKIHNLQDVKDQGGEIIQNLKDQVVDKVVDKISKIDLDSLKNQIPDVKNYHIDPLHVVQNSYFIIFCIIAFIILRLIMACVYNDMYVKTIMEENFKPYDAFSKAFLSAKGFYHDNNDSDPNNMTFNLHGKKYNVVEIPDSESN